ncbi:farnesyl pyrophosphate synthase-like [Solenopsis invicta]|uniref:farnesyl pyrophosphate synthase-like n=1 Tax=Solenopsis invicta TaxID=13686 RepID=UPI00193DCC01|nr:farnesyl pyrophosphate synthase-like [Solenopsis invicta]
MLTYLFFLFICQITLKTIDGQILDLQLPTNEEKPNLELFTMDTYNCIVRNKTSYYSVALPITIAMHLAGIKDRESFMQAESISLEIGHLFQVQDDFLDCFGDSEVSGKDSTDIQDGKCTWFIVVALQRAAPEQRKILEACYGFSDPEKVKRVKQLYTDLNLQKNYMLYKNKVYYSLNKRVQQMSSRRSLTKTKCENCRNDMMKISTDDATANEKYIEYYEYSDDDDDEDALTVTKLVRPTTICTNII